MISKRIWKSAVARILTQQQTRETNDDSIATRSFAQMQKGLSASDAVKILAQKLLASEKQTSKTCLQQIDLNSICAKIEVTVEYQPLSVDALLQETEMGFLAIVNSLVKESRQRKSLAHEIGHLIIYQATGLRQAFGHTSSNERQTSESLEIEELCDIFATELIMPSDVWRYLFLTEGISLSTLKKLKDFYGVSIATAAQRLVEVSLIECAVIIWTPIFTDDVLVKLNPVRCWEKITSEGKGQPQSIQPNQEFLVAGSPFDAFEKQSATIGKISISLSGTKGKCLAQSDIVDENYIITLLIPQRFGWETVFGKSKSK